MSDINKLDISQAISIIKADRRLSTASLQRRMKISYFRASKIINKLELLGIVGPDNGVKPRDINWEIIDSHE